MATKTYISHIDCENQQIYMWRVDATGAKIGTEPAVTLNMADLDSIVGNLPAGSPTLDIRFRQLKFKDPTSNPACNQVQIVLLCSQVIQGW